MVRSKVRYAVVAMVVCAAVLVGTTETQACWWRHCGNWGWGGYGCSYGYAGWYSPYSSWYGGYGGLFGCRLFNHCRYYSPCWGCYDACYDACGCGVTFDSGVVVPGAVMDGGVAPAPTPAPSPAQSEPDLPAPSMPAPPAP
ncbi:MAG: hypothetical protein HUU20_22150, partial [Pirellulales bacterium]|nr:hypothetical protein [Pirellulales bacterium]